MFRTVQDFIGEWQNETKETARVLETMTDATLGQRIAPNHRTLGQLGWHLATTIHEMLSRTGLEFAAPEGGEHAPSSAAAITEAYKRASRDMLRAVETQWTDETLGRTAHMYGEEWPNGITLHALIKHEVHHRGQMTVLLRQAGLRAPDIYGPTREVWIERGMQPLI